MDKDQLIEELLDIRSKGFIKTLRIHDTGIGYTFEELLGVKENNIQLPDIGEIGIKSKKNQFTKHVNSQTKSPLPKGVNKNYLKNIKYLDSDGKDCLHSTVYGSRINQQGFRVILQGKNIVLQNSKNITAYWPLTIFDDILKLKSNKIILFFAITKV